MIFATLAGVILAEEPKTPSRIITVSGTITIASTDMATSNPTTYSRRPPALICFFWMIGGTGDTASAMSATLTSNGSANVVAARAAMIGMATFIDRTARASNFGRRSKYVAILLRCGQAESQYRQHDAGLQSESEPLGSGHVGSLPVNCGSPQVRVLMTATASDAHRWITPCLPRPRSFCEYAAQAFAPNHAADIRPKSDSSFGEDNPQMVGLENQRCTETCRIALPGTCVDRHRATKMSGPEPSHHRRFLLTDGGPSHRLEVRLGLIRADPAGIVRRSSLCILVTWVTLTRAFGVAGKCDRPPGGHAISR